MTRSDFRCRSKRPALPHSRSETNATTVEEKIRSEYKNWLLPEGDEDTEGDTDDDERVLPPSTVAMLPDTDRR